MKNQNLMVSHIIEMPLEYSDIRCKVIGNYYKSVRDGSIQNWRRLPNNLISVREIPQHNQIGFIELPEYSHYGEQWQQYNN